MPAYGEEYWTLKTLSVVNPIAGGNFFHFPLRGVRQKLLGMRVRLTTDATVAVRRVDLVLVSSGMVQPLRVCPYTQAASTAYDYVWIPEGEDTNCTYDVATRTMKIVPPIYIDFMTVLWVMANNIQATDQFSMGQVMVREAIMPCQL
jgi:hypothetical protein